MTEPGSDRPTVRPRASIAPAGEVTREYLAFTLGTETYALPLSSVREIMTMQPLTEVPRAPRCVLGIFSVRGGVTTLMDMRRRLSVTERDLTSRARVLLVDVGSELVGWLVDAVDQVYRLSHDEVELAGSIGGDLSEHVVGIGRPGRGRTEEGASSSGRGRAVTATGENDILILLDPNALMKD